MCWLLTLQEYNFQVVYRAGKQNQAMNALTELPADEESLKPAAQMLVLLSSLEASALNVNLANDFFDIIKYHCRTV